ncbi:MAG: DUF262 domain-containing protein [Phycisphaerae bacterium]|nr:DUF262 domain-containing protein [Phycisphaerae bacterium]
MGKTDTTVGELVGQIESGELQLPEMQRRYVWRAPRVRDLLDSMYRAYPTGTILVWESDHVVPTQEFGVDQKTSPFHGRKLLLDGQQRLTSLSAVLRGVPVKVRGRRKPIDILFNLEHPDQFGEFTEVEADEESPLDADDDLDENGDDEDDDFASIQQRLGQLTFVVASKALAALPNWVSVTEVFRTASDQPFLKRAGVVSFDDPRYEKYTARLKRLRDIRGYPYVMQVLEKSLNYEEVAEIFVRVNSLGMKLRGSDLALAQITARWHDLLKLLEQFQDECEKKWFTFELGLLVRAMVVFASHQCRFRTVGSLSIEHLKQGWEEAKEGLRFAVNFLRSNAEIEDESMLSSPFLLIPIAVYSQLRKGKLTKVEERLLLFWLHVANARGRYSGSSETALDADLNVLYGGGAPSGLVDKLKLQFGRLYFEPADLEGRKARSPVFPLVFLALKEQGARDWHSGLGISLTHQGKLHFIQCHHIFPKALLQGRYTPKEINDIANMAFISGGTNRFLGKKDPAKYLPDIVQERGEDALTCQGEPLDRDLWAIENYQRFLAARRAELTKAINAHLDKARAGIEL